MSPRLLDPKLAKDCAELATELRTELLRIALELEDATELAREEATELELDTVPSEDLGELLSAKDDFEELLNKEDDLAELPNKDDDLEEFKPNAELLLFKDDLLEDGTELVRVAALLISARLFTAELRVELLTLTRLMLEGEAIELPREEGICSCSTTTTVSEEAAWLLANGVLLVSVLFATGSAPVSPLPPPQAVSQRLIRIVRKLLEKQRA